MQALAAQLQNHQAQLQQMRQRLAALQAQAAAAQNAPQLDQVSDQQQAFDPDALKEMQDLEQLLQDQQIDTAPPAPWTPPARDEEAMPVEHDTPEENPETNSDSDVQTARADDDKETEQQNWWDQPINTPQAPGAQAMSKRYADRNRATQAPPPSEQSAKGDASPREMLQEHQSQMDRALTENSNRLRTRASRPTPSRSRCSRHLRRHKHKPLQVRVRVPAVTAAVTHKVRCSSCSN